MKKVSSGLFALFVSSLFVSSASAAATCTPTGFMRDGINMTAAFINATVAQQPAVLNAAGCNIGYYYDHNAPSGIAQVVGREVYGANYFGILVNGDDGPIVVHINNNNVHNIGEVPFDGSQHGSAIYVRAFFGSKVTGDLNANLVSAYQKGGIVLNGVGVQLSSVTSNGIIGLGHIAFIAQNGLQVGYGAMMYPAGAITGNFVEGNSYDGHGDGSSSAGILLVGGPGYGQCPDGNDCPYTTLVFVGLNHSYGAAGNTLMNNDVGVYSSNLAADGVSTSPNPTNVLIGTNQISDDICYNPYQAGVSAQGNNDYILNNNILAGGGYGPLCGLGIDTTGSVNPHVSGNSVPPAAPAVQSLSLRSLAVKTTLKVMPEKP